MSTVRKVQSKANLPARTAVTSGGKAGKEKPVKKAEQDSIRGNKDSEQVSSPRNEGRMSGQEGVRTKKPCSFCKGRMEPHYYDSALLRKFTNDRGRILARGRSGACAKHQRRVSREIKRARILALLPFSPHV